MYATGSTWKSWAAALPGSTQGHTNPLCKPPTSSRASSNARVFKIACLEEIAFCMGYIDKEKLEEVAQSMRNSTYGDYLMRLLKE